jgi:serine/threonine protein kinase
MSEYVTSNGLTEETLEEKSVDYYEEPPTLSFGQEVDERYIVHEQVGEGGQADVYHATDVRTGCGVALKIPKVSNRDKLDRVIREAAVIAALSEETEGVVPFVGAGVAEEGEGTFAYIATEYMEEGNLEQSVLASPPGQLAINGIAKALISAWRGAAAARDAGLVHRDIKPSNVLLKRQDEGKLSDFGIVTAVEDDAEILASHHLTPEVVAESLTPTALVMGTVHFMPPEVLIDRRAFTQEGDILV